MMGADVVATVEDIYGRLFRSFVRYIVEAAGPTARTEWDRRAIDLFQSWNRDSREVLGEIEEFLHREKAHPDPPMWPLEYSQYNFVSGSYLLHPACEKMALLVDELEEDAGGLGVWPEAEELVARAIQVEDGHLRRAQALLAELPHEAPRPAVKKGVSANFW